MNIKSSCVGSYSYHSLIEDYESRPILHQSDTGLTHIQTTCLVLTHIQTSYIILVLVIGRLIGIGIEHQQNRAFDRESESH